MFTHLQETMDVNAWRIGSALAAVTLFVSLACSQTPTVHPMDHAALRPYAGVYQWGPNAFVYLQIFKEEPSGQSQLAAFDESGEVRTLYPTARDRFFAGPGYADSSAVEARIEFHRDSAGKVTSLTWRRQGSSLRTARRVETEQREDVRFSKGDIELAGTLIRPTTEGKHPAIVLVHGSGPADRENNLYFARFLIGAA